MKDKISVYYDYQIMLVQKFGGISRYFYELLTHISRSADVRADAYCIGNRNAYFESYFRKISSKYMRGMGTVNRFFSLRKAKKYDLIHPTYYHPYILRAGHRNVVITVYDMIHELFPELFPANDPTAENKRQMIYGADHIIAISENTKRDILKIYPDVSPDKITVIYLGNSLTPHEGHSDLALPQKYILFVGNRGGYKNFQTFFEGVKPILAETPDLYLVCIGGGAFSESERALMAEVSGQTIQMNAFDDDLSYAYSHALCFVFPSLYEGFGIPTLEAFACGCPVVLSNTSSMPEVGGDAAIYFDPKNAEEICGQIRRVIGDDALRKEMSERGKLQLAKFSWDAIAEQTIACYKKVLGLVE